jgi:hypothetical protein
MGGAEACFGGAALLLKWQWVGSDSLSPDVLLSAGVKERQGRRRDRGRAPALTDRAFQSTRDG